MKIGVLVCDHVVEELLPIQGAYDVMYAELLEGMEVKPFFVCDDDFPPSSEACNGWLVGGSVRSVYEDVDWIRKLANFTREANAAQIPYVGICFGHQMMAYALGGEVKKAEKGWCLGAHEFQVEEKDTWMNPFQKEVRVLMLCQDQVIGLPPNSAVLAKSPSCPIGMFTVGRHMLGMQGHPEFTTDYIKSIIQLREHRLGGEMVSQGIDSLKQSLDHPRIAGWIRSFFNERLAPS